MRRALTAVVFLAASFVHPGMAAHNQSHPDFSGTWELVPEQSDFGKNAKPTGATLVSEKKDGYLHSVQTTETPQGDQVIESDWYPDGQKHRYTKPAPGYSITHWDGDTLVNESRSDDGTFRQTTKLSLGDDGKTAVQTIEAHTASGNNHLRLVWRRKQ